jgi:hypothetical protein
VIESGAGWWHIVAESSEADLHYENLFPIEAAKDIIVMNMLRVYAVSDAEKQFFVENAASILSPPSFYVAPTHGYHEGNALIGL